MAHRSSRFSALGTAGGQVLEATRYLAAMMSVQRTERGPIMREISALNESVTAECLSLHRQAERAFVLPIARGSFARLAAELPELVDHIEGVAHMITAHRLGTPHEATTRVMAMIERSVEIEVEALGHLRNSRKLEEEYHELTRLVREARRALRESLAEAVADAPDARHALRRNDVLRQIDAVIASVSTIAEVLRAISIQES